ncbi:MAG: iron-containing alcohol dehydrogenase [Lachnospiraceae bacterium]|nr:iron-containing alcohol dehydrogenase [Lachnospiraceae bacterium]
MENFTFYSPTYFVFGKDEEKQVGDLVKKFNGSRVLIHYGGGSVVKSGLLDRVKKSLSDAGLTFIELGGVKPNPRSGLVYEGIKLCREEKVDFVLAVGGGSTIDSSKAIAAGTVYDGDFWDFYSGKLIEEALPVGTVLTIAAAGSEGSGDSVITNEDGMFKRGAHGEAIRPAFSILNPALTETLPPYQTACGVTDIMAHLLERYLTNSKDVVTTDRLIEGLLLAMIEEAPKVIENPHDYEARANIMWAGMMAHNNSCGVGRSQDWNSHDIEHELSAMYDCAHGAGLAVTFPNYLSYVYKHDIDRLVQLSVRVWGVEENKADPEAVIMEGIKRFRAFLKAIGMPDNITEFGAKESDIDALAHTACYGNGRDGFLHGFKELSEEDVKNIYKLML